MTQYNTPGPAGRRSEAAVRVSHAARTEQIVRELQSSLTRLAELQSQVATGKRFTRVAEDPYAASQVLRIGRGLRALDQYGRTGAAAQVRLAAEEAVVGQLDELLRQARAFATSFGVGDPPFTPEQTTQRQMAADHLTRVLDEAISLGNTKVGNEYILSGAETTTPAFDPALGPGQGAYQGDTRARTLEVAEGVAVTVNHTGDQFVGPAIAALKALRDAVDPANGQTAAQVQAQIQAVLVTEQALLVSQAETGSTARQIASIHSSHAVQRTDLETARGVLADVPAEEAITRLLSLHASVEASYAAASRVLSLSLTDYLR
jgi:flagellar hook-associated protein 3 FlgL